MPSLPATTKSKGIVQRFLVAVISIFILQPAIQTLFVILQNINVKKTTPVLLVKPQKSLKTENK